MLLSLLIFFFVCSIKSEETTDYDITLLQLREALAKYAGRPYPLTAYKRSDYDEGQGFHRGNAFTKYFGWQTLIVGIAVSVIAVFGVVFLVTSLVRRRRNSGKRASPQSMIGRFTGSTRSTSPHDSILGFDAGDKKLAHSAQMYHYQHQKQQMLAIEKTANQSDDHFSEDLPDEDSEQELENEVDYTVFECPGLAPTGDLEVKNPLFQGEGGHSCDEMSHFSHTESIDSPSAQPGH